MRIGHLITELGLGGAEKAVATVARGLKREGWEVHVACLFGPEPYGAVLEEAGIPVTDLEMGSPLDLAAIGRCRSWIRSCGLDLLHAFLFHANLMSRLARTGDLILVNSQRISGMESRMRRWILRLTGSRVDHHTALSRDTKEYLVRDIGVPRDRITVIPNGIDLEEFDRLAQDPDPRGGIPRIGTVGQMRRDRQKGYPTIVEAARRIPHARFLFCGDGAGRPAIESRIRRANLQRRISLVGQRRDVPSFLRGVDIYVQPSRWEGLPHAILEAMAARLPVIASRVGGVPELVEDGVTGILIPRDRPDALASAIRCLLEDPQKARAMGEAGRARIERHFTAASNVAAHLDLYVRLGSSR